MFGIWMIDILFFVLPMILIVSLGISIYQYVSAKKKNAKEPDTFSFSEIKTRKIVMIILSILTGLFLTVVIGIIALMFLAVAFM